jgi:hypothetical protein
MTYPMRLWRNDAFKPFFGAEGNGVSMCARLWRGNTCKHV